MPKGDIVLIPFPFTNLSGQKLKPALVLAETVADFTLAFITTQLHWHEPTDILLNPDSLNGIKKPSLIRLSKLSTVDKKLAVGKLGVISNVVKVSLDNNLRVIFDL